MRIDVLTNEQQLTPWLEPWRASIANTPSQSPHWCIESLKTFHTNDRSMQFIVCTDDEGHLLAMLPMIWDPTTRSLSTLGASGSDGLLSVFDFAAPNHMKIDWLALSQFLTNSPALPPWRSLVFSDVRLACPSAQSLRVCMSELGAPFQEHSSRWIRRIPAIPSNEPHEKSGRHGDHRSPEFEQKSRVDRIAWEKIRERWNIREKWIFDRHDFTEFLPVLMELHQRWSQHNRQLGCFNDPRLEFFLTNVSSKLLEENRLIAMTLSSRDKPIAAVVGWRSSDAWLALLAGFEPTTFGDSLANTTNTPSRSHLTDSPRLSRDSETSFSDEHSFEAKRLAELHMQFRMPFLGLQYAELHYERHPRALRNEELSPFADWIFSKPGARGATQHLWDASVSKIKSSWERWRR